MMFFQIKIFQQFQVTNRSKMQMGEMGVQWGK